MDVKKEIRELMEKNNISYVEMMAELSVLGGQLLGEGTRYMSDIEYQKYKEFKESGNDGLELALIGASWTHSFAEGIQTVKAMFDDVNFSKPFRIIVDYDPEQPRTIVKKYLTKESHESCSAAILEK